MATQDAPSHAQVGDTIETHGLRGTGGRHGQIVELLGEPGHEHYRVQWEDGHESIVYPADGVMIGRQRDERR
jgi:hypothetical protein